MPSYVIHLATGEEYLRKYKEDVKNKNNFLNGVIEPDQQPDREKSHYGEKSDHHSLLRFVQKNSIKSDFNKGYFLHLYGDYLLYSKYLPDIDLYDDYDVVTQYVMEKYHVKLPKHLSEYGNYKEGTPKYLTHDFLDHFIEEVTQKTIDEIVRELKGEQNEHEN